MSRNPYWPPTLIIALAWWLLSRPYHGIEHDGVLYTVQALRRLFPERFAQDIFFLYGSQDNFTIFSIFHAWLISLLGAEPAFLLLSMAGGAIWLIALLVLLRRWLSKIPLIVALILVLSADAHYAGFDLFAFGERFATPRLFAEALVLFSIPLWLDGKRLAAACLVAGAMLLHPLIALAGIGVFCWSAFTGQVGRPIVLWGMALGAGLLGLQFLIWTGISPHLDPFWRHAAELRSPFVFPYLWNPSDWLRLALDATLLGLAARHVREEAGTLAGWVLPVLALAIVWALAAGMMGVQLAVAAQLQRVQWLAHLLALALVVPLCLRLWQTGDHHDRYLSVGVASSLIFPLNLGGLVLPIVYGMYLWAGNRMAGRPLPRGLHLLLLIGVPLMGLALWLFYTTSNLIAAQTFGDTPVWLILMRKLPVAMCLFLGLYAIVVRLEWVRAGLWIYGLSLLALGLLSWDESKPWGMYERAGRAEAIAPVKKLIPEHAVVFWARSLFVNPGGELQLEGGARETWLWLNRAHYASHLQAAGDVFYRQTASEISRRMEHLHKWGFREDTLEWKTRNKIPEILPLTETRLKGICGDRILDFVIANTRLPSAQLSFNDPLTGRKFGVYDCRRMRR
jgi:hypothetical protein